MKRALTALVLIPLVLLVVFKAPLWVFIFVVGAFALVSTNEYLAIARKYDSNLSPLPGLIAVTCFFALLAWDRVGNLGYFPRFVGFFVLFFYPLFLLGKGLSLSDSRSALTTAAFGTFLIPYIVLPLLTLIVIRETPHGWFFMVFLFVMVWSGDVFAYYIGKNFGKHLLAPRASPKKTWEGTVASLVGCVLVSVVFCRYAPGLEKLLISVGVVNAETFFESPVYLKIAPIWVSILVALLVNVAAQVGDLVESMIKRGANIKDSGNILPGHGGLLDRVDALLFAAPVAMLLFLATSKYFVP